MDGVSFARADSVLGVWVYNVVTQLRHLAAVFRKSELCQCGCDGWCSLFPLFSWLHWSFCALAEGKYPRERHDQTPFNAKEQTRAELAGTEVGFRMAVTFVKGDWS
eukprot:7396061-Alexandrium_andersonii.AAC.1